MHMHFSNAIKILLMPSLWGEYDVIKQFSISFQVEIRAPLSFIRSGWNLALISNIYVLSEQRQFLRKTENFAQALLDKSLTMATP